MSTPVTIFLATYNGAQHLQGQIQSFLDQSHTHWHLWIRDDGSSDRTPDILARYQTRFPEKISVLKDSLGNLGPSANFSELMRHGSTDYYLFSDQDDVWLPEKIECTLQKMLELAARHGPETPLLVHTDLKVVDENLNPIADSFWKYQKINPIEGKALNRLLVQNTVNGCTMMINRKLRDLAYPVPREAIMHDGWITLVAALFGHIETLPQPTLLYRLHGQNNTGAALWNIQFVGRRAFGLLGKNGRDVIRQLFAREYRQAAKVLERYQDRMSPAQRDLLEKYGHFDQFGFFRKRYYLLKYRFFYEGLVRNIGRLLIS